MSIESEVVTYWSRSCSSERRDAQARTGARISSSVGTSYSIGWDGCIRDGPLLNATREADRSLCCGCCDDNGGRRWGDGGLEELGAVRACCGKLTRSMIRSGNSSEAVVVTASSSDIERCDGKADDRDDEGNKSPHSEDSDERRLNLVETTMVRDYSIQGFNFASRNLKRSTMRKWWQFEEEQEQKR